MNNIVDNSVDDEYGLMDILEVLYAWVGSELVLANRQSDGGIDIWMPFIKVQEKETIKIEPTDEEKFWLGLFAQPRYEEVVVKEYYTPIGFTKIGNKWYPSGDITHNIELTVDQMKKLEKILGKP